MRLIHATDAVFASDPPPIFDQTGLTGVYQIFLKISGPQDDLNRGR